MKRLSLYLFFILFTLQTPSLADDIRDFQIEGMSVGGSLLDYFSEEEIKSWLVRFYPSSSKFHTKELNLDKSDNYDVIAFEVKANDPNYIIYAIAADKAKEYNDCKIEQKKIAEDFKTIFDNKFKFFEGEAIHDADPSGKSKYYVFQFKLYDGSGSRIICTDWDEKFSKKNYSKNGLTVTLESKEYIYWITNEAYK